jgi:uncharacterized LabA/DUF88 family protein
MSDGSGYVSGSGKPRAVAFVDYEHWYISMDNLYHQKPDLKGWRDELARKYELTEIVFFADFSNPSLREEISRIREITNVIIETQNASPHFQKDFTDFIMLDHIYQKAISSGDIDVFIIFTGDGHFSSAVSFLRTRIGKPVVVYAVRDCCSGQLKGTATETIEIPQRPNARSSAAEKGELSGHTGQSAPHKAEDAAKKSREAEESRSAERSGHVRPEASKPAVTRSSAKQGAKSEAKQASKPAVKPAVRTEKRSEKTPAAVKAEPVKTEEREEEYASMILKNLKYLEDANKTKEKQSLPTFWGTVDAVSHRCSLPKTKVTAAMRKMMADGYIYQTEMKIGENPDVKILNVRWEQARKDGLID